MSSLLALFYRLLGNLIKPRLLPNDWMSGTKRLEEGSLGERPGKAPSFTGPLSFVEGKKMRLMVVEDQEDCAFVLAKRLELQGHEVRVCYNACSALLTAPEFEPHAVLLDIGLPEMDGWQLAPLLRDSLADRPVQLIAISGFQSENDFMRSRAAGIDHHLPKPDYFDRLSELLSQLA